MPPDDAPAPKSRGWMRLLIVFVVAFDVAAFFQWADGAFQSEFGGHPDEAVHYLTSLRVRDAAVHDWERARSGGGISVRQPIAALKRTPVFDVAQGGWMLVFGTSRIAVLLFMATLAAATATLIFSAVRRELGGWAAIVAAVVWLFAPAVRESYGTILPGQFGAFTMTAALLLWARWMNAGSLRHAAVSKWLGRAAVLGGGSVLALALAVTLKLLPGDPHAALSFLKESAFVPGIAVAAFALAGAVIRPRSETRPGAVWVAMTALVAGVLLARWMKAGVPDMRTLIVATPALAMLATRGAVLLGRIVATQKAGTGGSQSRR
ncbi:MAG: hypothetical protein ABI318_18945, partial [Chthoniobacteraceae bacterium]